MERQRTAESYIKSLEGISHLEWTKVRIAIDRVFDINIGELKNDLQLTDTELALRFIP